MEYVIAVFSLKGIQTADQKSFFIADRISAGSDHNTDSRIIFKFQIDLIQRPVNAGFHDFDHVCLHPRQNDLCFRISESGVILQYLRSILRQHQPEENDSFKFSALCRHCIYRRLINMLLAVFVDFFRVEGAGRKCTHSACIQSRVAVSGPLVILRRRHRPDRPAVYKRKHRNFPARHKFLNHHTVSRGTEFFISHDFLYAVLRFLQRIADQDAFSQSKAIRFQHDRESGCLQVFQRRIRVCKILICSRRNMVFFH